LRIFFFHFASIGSGIGHVFGQFFAPILLGRKLPQLPDAFGLRGHVACFPPILSNMANNTMLQPK
jgi:hypothetical protein